MTKLNAQARDTLRNAGITPKQWAIIQGQPDGKWYGDACGCNDDRCIGYHHDELNDCGCLPALLELYFWPPEAVAEAWPDEPDVETSGF